MTRKILLILCLLAGAIYLRAGSPRFSNIGLKQGLSNGFVNDMAIDGQGFLWIATEGGVNRIAGNKCSVFKTNNSDVSSDSYIGLLYDKATNAVWMLSKEGHIDIYHCKTQRIEHFCSEARMKGASVAAINVSSSGKIWIAYYNGYVQLYDQKSKKCSTTISNRLFPHNKNGARFIADDGKGHLYIGMRMDGLYIYNLKTQKSKLYVHQSADTSSLPGNNVRSVCVDHMQNIWVGTNNGLAIFDNANGKFRVFKHHDRDSLSLAGDNIHQITEMDDHTLWISSDIGGISVLDLDKYRKPLIEQPTFRQIIKENSELSSNSTRRVLQDSFGNIWIGNFSSGIDFMSNSEAGFHTLSYKGNAFENVNGIYFDQDRNCLWLGQDGNIVQYIGEKAMRDFNFSSCLSNSSASVYFLEKDHLGNIWFGTNDNGVLTYNPSSGTFFRLSHLRNIDVHALHEDKHGKMWIGCEEGLYSVENRIEKEEKEINSKIIKEINSKTEKGINRKTGKQKAAIIYTITEDCNGQLWIGTFSSGVFVFNSNKRLVIHLDDSNYLKSNTINHIICDKDGGIWIGTAKGLAYVANPLKPQDIRIYDERQGIKDSHIRAICQDRQGNMWVSMFSGIACLDMRRQRFHNYDYHNGIPTGNFVEASAAISPDGAIYFGSPSGVCYFTPQTINSPQSVPQVQIISCERIGRISEQAFSSIISPDSNGALKLEYNDNTFKITFTVQDFGQKSDVDYSYMMKGLDGQWYETEGDDEVSFRNIKPGDYTFMIRAKLKSQDWDEASVAEMPITVCPPLWLTWWAKLAYLISFIGLAYYFARSYQKQITLRNSLKRTQWESEQRHMLNEERMRFFTNITHELRTPLTLILGPLEDLMAEKALPPRAAKKISSIHASAERLLELINDILEFRKTQTQHRKLTVAKDNIVTFVRGIGSRFQELSVNKNVQIVMDMDEQTPEIYFDSEVITIVVNNLMSNAIKYTPHGFITLSVKQVPEDKIAISVKDTGYGINKADLPHICERYYQENSKHQASGTGIGLALVKALALLHDAELNIESTQGEGSTFSFVLKKDSTYPNALHKDDEPIRIGTGCNEEPNCDASKGMEKECQPPLVLVVEDNADIRQYIHESLSEDYRILQACNGKTGRDMALEQMPDIIVSDIMMPEMDGIEMTRLLKKDIRTSHVPIILLTAKTSSNDQEEGYNSGADSYLMKPFSAKLLLSRIRNILSGRRRLAEYIVKHSTADIQERNDTADEEREETTSLLSELDRRFMEKLNKLIADNIATENLDMAFMTDKMAMSHSTFYRKVKALTGMSANEYIKKAKLRHSMALLQTKKYSVTDVAQMAGFNSLGNFRESFKKEFGLMPSEVIKGTLNHN